MRWKLPGVKAIDFVVVPPVASRQYRVRLPWLHDDLGYIMTVDLISRARDVRQMILIREELAFSVRREHFNLLRRMLREVVQPATRLLGLPPCAGRLWVQTCHSGGAAGSTSV